MQPFKEYIQEKQSLEAKIGKYYTVQWLDSAWKHILGRDFGKRSIPLTSKLFQKIWATPIRVTAFHITDEEGAIHVLRNQNKKGTALSVMPRAPRLGSPLMINGIWKSGVILKMNANILMAGKSDIMSVPDRGGRRWVAIEEVERIVVPELQASFLKQITDNYNTAVVYLIEQLEKLVETISNSGEYVTGAFDAGETGNMGVIEFLLSVKKEYTSKPDGRYRTSGRLVSEIDRLTEKLNEKDQKRVNTLLFTFVKKHIEDTNKIMETFLSKSREQIEQIAKGQDYNSVIDLSNHGYEELVANEYKILAVLWYPADKWGIKLEKLKTAVGDIPFFNLGIKQKQSTFKNLAGVSTSVAGGWLPGPDAFRRSEYKKFKK